MISVAVPGKKGRVMERRLLKDFTIGIVEGIVSEAIREKEPMDVFSKIAKAIGKRSSSSKGKKDWNAMVRKNTVRRDPIGSTTEAMNRQSRQSLRRHILEHQGSALSSMDPDKLLEYNPKLSEVSPAARVAYAKFKIAKIKQEYDTRDAAGSDAGSIKQDDDVFEPPVKVTTDTEKGPTDVSIVRPRPKSSIKSVTSIGAIPPPETISTVQHMPEPFRKEFRPKTPILEDPREDMQSPTPSTPKSVSSMREPETPTKSLDEQEEETGQKDDEKGKKDDTKKDDKKGETGSKSSAPSAPPPPTSTFKPAGKSKVTGQVMQGWL